MGNIFAWLHSVREAPRQRGAFALAAMGLFAAVTLGLVLKVSADQGAAAERPGAAPPDQGIVRAGRRCAACGEVATVEDAGLAAGGLQVTLRMDDGARQQFNALDSAHWRPGERVILIH